MEIVGPCGTARGRAVLAGWLARSGFTADVLRWFCGSGGRVVVEQEWAVSYYQRHESLDHALRAAGLDSAAEVTSRS